MAQGPTASPHVETTTERSADEQEVAAEVSKLKEDKLSLEIELSSLKAASGADARERADIISSERKYRTQVSPPLNPRVYSDLIDALYFDL